MSLPRPRPHWRRDQYRFSEEDRDAYRTGAWLGTKLSDSRVHQLSDEQCAAELAARVRLMLEER